MPEQISAQLSVKQDFPDDMPNQHPDQPANCVPHEDRTKGDTCMPATGEQATSEAAPAPPHSSGFTQPGHPTLAERGYQPLPLQAAPVLRHGTSA
jgi:hypothetical protein